MNVLKSLISGLTTHQGIDREGTQATADPCYEPDQHEPLNCIAQDANIRHNEERSTVLRPDPDVIQDAIKTRNTKQNNPG